MATLAPSVKRAFGRRWNAASVLMWATLIISTAISLWPMYWLFVTALTPTQDSIKTPPDLIPIHASFSNIQRLFAQARDYWRWAGNSLFVALSVTIFHIIFDTLAGYGTYNNNQITFNYTVKDGITTDVVTATATR